MDASFSREIRSSRQPRPPRPAPGRDSARNHHQPPWRNDAPPTSLSQACYGSARMLPDQVTIVTGAGQGIGRAIAVELAKAGAHVVACGRRLTPLEAVAGDIRALGR